MRDVPAERPFRVFNTQIRISIFSSLVLLLLFSWHFLQIVNDEAGLVVYVFVYLPGVSFRIFQLFVGCI